MRISKNLTYFIENYEELTGNGMDTCAIMNHISKNGHVRYYDTAAHAYYLYNGTDFISYDDPESVREKCRYVLEKNLLGIMYWEHGCDKTHTLVHSMGEVLI